MINQNDPGQHTETGKGNLTGYNAKFENSVRPIEDWNQSVYNNQVAEDSVERQISFRPRYDNYNSQSKPNDLQQQQAYPGYDGPGEHGVYNDSPY